MKYQILTVSSTEYFTFKSTRKAKEVLYFSVTLVSEKMFDNGRNYYSDVNAKIHYIAHLADDEMPLADDAPYRRVVNKKITNSVMSIKSNTDGWSFVDYVQVPTEYRAFGVGRTVLNLIVKKAIEIAPNESLGGRLEGGDPKKHALRDSLYENMCFEYIGDHFTIDSVDRLKTFDEIKNVKEVDLEEEFLEICQKNEELTKSLASTKKEAAENYTKNNAVEIKYNRCKAHRFWCVSMVIFSVAIYLLLT